MSAAISEHIWRTLILALPVMLSRAGIVVLIVVDVAMTGHAGTLELAYYALGNAPQLLILLIGIGAMMGTVILTAQADGAGQSQQCGGIWRVAMMHALGYGLLLLLLSYGGERMLLLFGQEADLARGGGEVIIILGWSLPAMMMYVTTTMFLEGINRPLPSLVVMLLANLLNLVLNSLFIYGQWGLPALGAEGAALATTIVRWFMLIALVAYAYLQVDRRHYGIVGPIVEPRRLGRRLRRLGYPLALSAGLESSAFNLMTMFAGLMGPVQVAAFQSTLSMISLVFMFALGFSLAASVRVANAMGRRDGVAVRRAGWVATGLAMLMLAACSGVFFIIPEQLAAIYTDEVDVALVVTAAIAMAVWVLVPDGMQAVLMGALRGMADVWPATLLFLIAFWVVMVPAGYVLGIQWQRGAVGLVQAMALGCVVAVVLLAGRFYKVSKHTA